MRLTVRFIAAVTAAILLVLGVNAFVRIQRETALFDDDIRRDTRLLGRTLAGAVSRIWTTVGESEALDLVADADDRESHVVITWHWLAADEVPPGLTTEQRQALRSGNEVIAKRLSPEGKPDAISNYVPVALPDGRLAAIELQESLAIKRHYVSQTMLQAAVTTGSLVLLCGLLASVLGVLFIGRPVRRLVDQARRIGAGDLTPEPAPTRGDELGILARELNAMCERLQQARQELEAETETRLATQEQLRHADRLTTVGKLAAGIAHEIGTPLNVITGHAQLLRDDYPNDSPAAENAAIIGEQAHRVANIVRQLLDFARQRTPRKARCDLADLVRRVATFLEPLAHKRKLSIEVDEPLAELEVEVDAGQIQQVVTNLVVNGLQATASGGAVTIRVAQTTAAPPGEEPREVACIEVEDRGSGISESTLPRIFEPFFTTKEVGDGTGLGLSVAYGIVREHGGWIDVQSEAGAGSRFSVYLPMGGNDGAA